MASFTGYKCTMSRGSLKTLPIHLREFAWQGSWEWQSGSHGHPVIKAGWGCVLALSPDGSKHAPFVPKPSDLMSRFSRNWHAFRNLNGYVGSLLIPTNG